MWNLEKIKEYIDNQIEESLHLDYKASDSLQKTDGKKNEIAKDVSSFANSDGGIIIYGIKEFQHGTTFLPEKIDAINRNDFSKEALEQIINSRISPRILGVKITPIILNENDQVIYIVEIPKSDTAHQASDKRYYRRFNFQSVPMDDWEIKDIFNRKSKAEIEVTIVPKISKTVFDSMIKSSGIPINCDIIATNIGNKVVEYIDCMIIGNEETSKNISPRPLIQNNYFELYYSNEEHFKVKIKDDEFTVNTKRSAILPKTYRVIGSIKFFSDFFLNENEIRITVTMDDNRITRNLKGINFIEFL